MTDHKVEGDTSAAVAFLEAWSPSGPWVLTSIIPDGKTTTATFQGTEAGRTSVCDWINRRQGSQNIYFTVNPVMNSTCSKPTKADVRGMIALHVDIDPRAGENLATERNRALNLLQEFKPQPTVIIDSGGGYQAFWMFDRVYETNGHPEKIAELEAYNIQLETILGADSCHNIDRIMRLPGTVNVPNARKVQKGRKPAPTRVVQADWQRRYRLEDFTPAVRKHAGSDGRTAASAIRSVAVAESVDVSKLPLSDRVKALIVNGTDPDEPGRWADRSRLVLHVLCEMIRADLPEGVMKAIILDPDLGISAHVREQKGAERYADRQIQRALDQQPRPGPVLGGGPMDWARSLRDAKRPRLLHHHEEFLDWDGAAYVNVPDATMRAEAWTFLETCRAMDKEGNLRQFMPRPETVGGTLDALRAVSHLPSSREEPPRWLDGRAEPDPLELLPTRSGLLHLPTGNLLPATPELFTRNALDFAHAPDAPEPRRWLNFLRDVWPDVDEADCIAALQEFMGYLLTPDTRLQKALLIPGPKRSGKGTIGRVMAKLVGEANTVAPSLNSLGRSDFGLEPLLAKQLAIVSDMRLSGRTDEAAVAEAMLRITGEDRVSVNRKHRHAVEVTLRTRFVLMTNEVPKFADRSGALVSRFVVLPMNQSFYGREDPDLTAALMGELPGILNWAVEGWRRVRAAGRITQPQAGFDVALQMGDLSSPIPSFVRECCALGDEMWIEKERLFTAFREWHLSQVHKEYMGSSSIFARDLYSAMDGQVRERKPRDRGERVRAFGGIDLRPSLMGATHNDVPPF